MTIDSLRQTPEGEAPSREALRSTLAQAWETHGPTAQSISADYRELANRLIDRLASSLSTLSAVPFEETAVRLTNGEVLVEPDIVGRDTNGIVHVRLVRYGRLPATGTVESLHVLAQLAARQLFPTQDCVAEVMHLTDDAILPVNISNLSQSRHLRKIEQALAAHSARHFEPMPKGGHCARCPHLFVCPSLPKATIAA